MSFNAQRSRKIPVPSALEGNFLEASLPARAFVTLTTLHRVSRHSLDEMFLAWSRSLQARHKMQLGWIKTIELYPKPHIHAALIAAAPLDCKLAELLWRTMAAPRYSDAAKVEPYKEALCGMGYVLKQLDSSMEEIQFSDNICAFAPGDDESLFRSTSAQRRQTRRIRRQVLK